MPYRIKKKETVYLWSVTNEMLSVIKEATNVLH